MLDTDTRRRIDTARDILVGKVPDPKSQVEQITIALIYKFMDDMDAQSEELGGKRKFFAGEFARYGWSKLMRSGLGGHEMLGLYAESIQRMPENPGIPPLFRDIFKNAYLPYRDPETLRAFLKVIDEFSYDHSERLGDAFEYLLSVLGSQGEAGQFRTPRHIIDFMVEIVDPKLGERVLDPACGTAGFLISAYKHILKANRDDKGNVTLTPDQRQTLARSFTGYDISPDMVRLSLVNMYLHGFSDPHIHEYDTLTSLERWNEFADVILANPPFMSPKGGIRPHNRFAVQSKRSEVLFVDYMAEHLSPNGRAGIIVPEGIIFQSQGAYVQLRKKLVEESLVAVISLPAGVFNPYSGVKTSILILDKALAKKADSIAFFRVESDGFDLGAQRKPTDGNDLPSLTAAIQDHLRHLRLAETPAAVSGGAALVVPKTTLEAGEEYGLSGERYRINGSSERSFPLRSVGDVAAEIRAGFASGNSGVDVGGVPHVRPMNITVDGTFTREGMKFIPEAEFQGREVFSLEPGDVLFNNTNSQELVGKTCLVELGLRCGYSNHITRIRVRHDQCLPRFLALMLHHAWRRGDFAALANRWVGQAGVNTTVLSGFTFPLPPLDVQREIVAEIEGYQKVIDGARAVVENYRPTTPVDPSWPEAELKTVCAVNPGFDVDRVPAGAADVSFVPMADLGEHSMYFEARQTRRLGEVASKYTAFADGDVLLAKVTPCFENGKAGVARGLTNGLGFGSSEFYVLRPGPLVLAEWVYMWVASARFATWAIPQMTGTGGLQRVPRATVEEFRIPVPPIQIQAEVVAEVKAEQAAVDASRELIGRFEEKTGATLARVWGDSMREGT